MAGGPGQRQQLPKFPAILLRQAQYTAGLHRCACVRTYVRTSCVRRRLCGRGMVI